MMFFSCESIQEKQKKAEEENRNAHPEWEKVAQYKSWNSKKAPSVQSLPTNDLVRLDSVKARNELFRFTRNETKVKEGTYHLIISSFSSSAIKFNDGYFLSYQLPVNQVVDLSAGDKVSVIYKNSFFGSEMTQIEIRKESNLVLALINSGADTRVVYENEILQIAQTESEYSIPTLPKGEYFEVSSNLQVKNDSKVLVTNKKVFEFIIDTHRYHLFIANNSHVIHKDSTCSFEAPAYTQSLILSRAD